MGYGNNVNDNVNQRFKKNNVNDNDRYSRAKQVDLIADKLVEKLQVTSKSRDFLCKAAWKLPEARIWSNVEAAKKGKNPMGLFIYLCKKDGV